MSKCMILKDLGFPSPEVCSICQVFVFIVFSPADLLLDAKRIGDVLKSKKEAKQMDF